MMLSSSAVDRCLGTDWKRRRSSSPLDSWSPAALRAQDLINLEGAASTSHGIRFSTALNCLTQPECNLDVRLRVLALEGASRKRMPSEQMQLSICSCRELFEPSPRSASRR